MEAKYTKVHNQFRYNGLYFNFEGLKALAYSFIKEGVPYEKEIGRFLMDWLSAKDHILVKTSGSTGQPKIIKIYKQTMVNSAIATGDFFNLKSGDTALGCLPSHYIAGKMMLVRALILGLNIDWVEPTSKPIFDFKKHYDFCAMVPLQLQNVITYSQNIRTIIIGGSKPSISLLQEIKKSSLNIYETYGMTETVTHVAAKQLPSKVVKGDVFFTALPSVSFQKDERNCLVIKAPKITDEVIITNDIVDLKSETSFKWLGRFDNVINSGGVKLFPEQIEEKLQPVIKERFIIASKSDALLGEKLILIIENPSETIETIQKRIQVFKGLEKFEKPKDIYKLNSFFETLSGKVQRKKTIEAIF